MLCIQYIYGKLLQTNFSNSFTDSHNYHTFVIKYIILNLKLGLQARSGHTGILSSGPAKLF
jgi:hypothetical protein